MKIYHYTKAIKLHSIFEDGFIATERKRSLSKEPTHTDFVWLTEKLSYPKTALPLLSPFPETSLAIHLQHKGIVVDLDKIGKVFGKFYRFGFDNTEERFKKWFYSKERDIARCIGKWIEMESTANKVGDEIRSFWISTSDLLLENFSLEIFENGKWNVLISNASLSQLTDSELQIIEVHKRLSYEKCKELGIPHSYLIEA